VRIHYRWRKLVAADSAATAEEREAADAEYHAALEKFEDDHGELVNAYWCADFESGVALTAGKPHNSRLRRLLSVSPKFHRVSDWATKDDPEVARLLHKCDELAIRASEVLRGRSRRICIQLVMTSACHLLSLVDARELRQSTQAHKTAVAAEARELAAVARDYREAANGDAQLVYFGGMAIGAAFLALIYVLGGSLLTGEDIQDSTIRGCLVAGAVGAVVSVISRINTGSFDLDEDIARGYTLFLGGLRPVLGSIFGLLTYFAITSNFVEVFKVPPDGIKQFYFLCVIAFAAGFSERWAQDTLTGGLTGRGREAAAAAKPAAKPAAKATPKADPKAGATSAAGAAADADGDGAVD
jgi:VIT1/CCC1 family predicted Fe2+/Mn2+ transporter